MSVKITDLGAVQTPLVGDELLECVQNGLSRRVRADQIASVTADKSMLTLTDNSPIDLVDTMVALRVGATDPDTEAHIEVDFQAIQAKTDATTPATLTVNPVGGVVELGTDARTVGAASGGLEVNNLLTGAGFERVLTTSDMGGAVSFPIQAGDNDTIEWGDGPDWLQRFDPTSVSADGDLVFQRNGLDAGAVAVVSAVPGTGPIFGLYQTFQNPECRLQFQNTNQNTGMEFAFTPISGNLVVYQTNAAGRDAAQQEILLGINRNSGVTLYGDNNQLRLQTRPEGTQLTEPLYFNEQAAAGTDLSSNAQVFVREGSAGDPLFSEVELLADMDGPDGATSYTEISNNGFSAGFNGNAQLDTAQFNSGVSSLLLDGAGDWMSYADNVAFDMGTGDWTVEGFVRFNSIPPSGPSTNPGYCLFSQWGAAGSDQKLAYSIIQDGFGVRVQLRTAGGILELGTISGGISTGVWYHWAVTRSSTDNNVRAYFNGNYETADFGLSDADMGRSSEGIRIGSLDGTQGFHDGWIDDVRYTVGTARYSGTGSYSIPSTPYPTGPGDQNLIFRREGGAEVVLDEQGGGGGTPGGADTQVQFNDAGSFGGSVDFTWDGTRLGFTNSIPVRWEDTLGVEVEMLIFDEIAFGASPVEAETELYVDWDGMAGDTTFDDDDGNTWTQRNVSAVISSFAKFGPGSMVIQGGVSGGFGSPDPSFPNFTGDFSFGFWYYLDDDNVSSSFTGGNTIFGRRNSGDSGGWRWRVLINNGDLSFNYRTGSPGSENNFIQFGPATVRNQWLYCVVERDGGTIRGYVGGSEVGSSVADASTLFMGGGDTQVFAEGFSGIDDDLYIDDITILNGATVYEGSGGGEPPGDPANPSGDFETFVVGDPVYRTLIDGEDVFLGKQSEQVARTTDAASGGFLVNNQNTGAGFERVLTESDGVATAGTDEQTLVYVGTALTPTDFFKHDNQNVIEIEDQFSQTHTWSYNVGGGSLLEFSSTNISDFRVPRTLSIAEGAGGSGVLSMSYSGNFITFNTNEASNFRFGNGSTGISIMEMFQGARIRWLEVGGLDPIEQWNDGTHLRFDITDGGVDGFRLDGNASIFLDEQSAAQPDIAGYGQIWIQQDDPVRLKFTDDTGQDFDIAVVGGYTNDNVFLNSSRNYNSAGNFAANNILYYADGSNNTVTLEDSSSTTNWPVYTSITIIAPGSGVQTIAEGTGTTLFDDTGTDLVGGCTVSGGVQTIFRASAANYIIFGSGITP